MVSDDPSARSYSSPLRESQAQRTRHLILDALTALLADHRVDEVSTKQIAGLAGVSLPTVYRHFPDRAALVDGLADRIDQRSAFSGLDEPATVEACAALAEAFFMEADEHAPEATAEAVMNADPRRFSAGTVRRSEDFRRAVARSLPELDEREQLRLAALMRTLFSVQTWLRMREEFGMSGDESGQTVGWALRTLLRRARDGNLPGSSDAYRGGRAIAPAPPRSAHSRRGRP